MQTEQRPITVVLATDSFLIGDGLIALVNGVADVEVIGRARDHDELLQLATELLPDALIIAIRTPAVSTMATVLAARHLRAEYPDLGIVVISERVNGYALELLRDGASRIAFLLDENLPDFDAVLGALRALRSGQSVLDPCVVDSLVQRSGGINLDAFTLREVDVLEQMAHGLSNKAVAAELNVSVKAVEKYITLIFRKLGLTEHALIDRRVIAALTFLRSQADPFRPDHHTDACIDALVAPRDSDETLLYSHPDPHERL